MGMGKEDHAVNGGQFNGAGGGGVVRGRIKKDLIVDLYVDY